MRHHELQRQVARLFPAADGPRGTGVAVEQEVLLEDALSGGVVHPDRVAAAVAGRWYAAYLGFEPGGQVELSLPPRRTPEACAALVARAGADLAADVAAAGMRVVARPVDPRTVPLQRRTSRYLAMQRHFDRIGPAGRTMMRRTASTQVCLDWWPGGVGVEQWRVLHLAGPALAAAFARSAGPDSRLATWLDVDPSRTAFDSRLLAGRPEAAYLRFAAAATPFLAGAGEHLSTLFPPVRPRGHYLEVRFLDVQPDVAEVVATLAALVHDARVRRAVLARLDGEAGDLADRWRSAALGDPAVAAEGRAIARACGQRLRGAA